MNALVYRLSVAYWFITSIGTVNAISVIMSKHYIDKYPRRAGYTYMTNCWILDCPLVIWVFCLGWQSW